MKQFLKAKPNLRSKLILHLINDVRVQNALQSAQISQFINKFFDNFPDHAVIQVGANGITQDPIQDRFITHSGRIVLVEPVPYLCNALSKQFHDSNNIYIENSLIGSGSSSSRRLFYIDPEIADEMDGNGPPNKWAHGQGSFNIESIHYWIEKNKFRGKHYRLNVSKYKQSILSEEVKQVTLAQIVNTQISGDFGLLIIDVQGAELEVVQSLKGSHFWPSIIVCETDSSASLQGYIELDRYLNDRSYVKLFTSTDSLWI